MIALFLAQTTVESEKAKEASRTVPHIILAMGAERVEAVSEISCVSDQSFETFDFVLVKDLNEFVHDLPNDVVMVVHLPWVKECLIAGRLLDTPA